MHLIVVFQKLIRELKSYPNLVLTLLNACQNMCRKLKSVLWRSWTFLFTRMASSQSCRSCATIRMPSLQPLLTSPQLMFPHGLTVSKSSTTYCHFVTTPGLASEHTLMSLPPSVPCVTCTRLPIGTNARFGICMVSSLLTILISVAFLLTTVSRVTLNGRTSLLPDTPRFVYFNFIRITMPINTRVTLSACKWLSYIYPCQLNLLWHGKIIKSGLPFVDHRQLLVFSYFFSLFEKVFAFKVMD